MDELSDGQLETQVAVGEQIKNLVHHKGHQMLMEILKADADRALEELKIEKDIDKIKELQNIIWRHDELASKMYTLIAMGQEAKEELINGGDYE